MAGFFVAFCIVEKYFKNNCPNVWLFVSVYLIFVLSITQKKITIMKKIFQIWTKVFNYEGAPSYQPTSSFDTLEEAFQHANNPIPEVVRYAEDLPKGVYPAAVFSRSQYDDLGWRWMAPAEAEGGFFIQEAWMNTPAKKLVLKYKVSTSSGERVFDTAKEADAEYNHCLAEGIPANRSKFIEEI